MNNTNLQVPNPFYELWKQLEETIEIKASEKVDLLMKQINQRVEEKHKLETLRSYLRLAERTEPGAEFMTATEIAEHLNSVQYYVTFTKEEVDKLLQKENVESRFYKAKYGFWVLTTSL